MRKRYVAVGNSWVEVDPDYIPEPQASMVMPDIQPYQSMADGTMITSRSHHREHLRRHGLIEVGNETKHLTPKPKALPKGRKEMVAQLVYERLRYK